MVPVEKPAISIFDSGCIDLKIIPSNDIVSYWFWLIGVAMFEGATYDLNDLSSSV